jgi:ATP/maltotriose-dependent transcriptional regulator MalT/DNA-binding SARP family transcriptional activator
MRSAAFAELALAHRLTLVVAGAGWGKSTRLRALAEAVPSIEISSPPSGWTPFALARSLVDACATASGADVADALPSYPAPDLPGNPDHAAALAAVVCDVGARTITRHTVLVWDDADVTEGDPLEQFVETLVLNLPPMLHLVLACRSTPRMRLARLRANGEVARVGAAELGVLPDDVGEGDLPAAAVDTIGEIIAATGGWPIAVRLAAEALRRDGPIDREELIDRLLTPTEVLYDYLAEEVFAGLPTADRDVLRLAAELPDIAAAMLVDLGHGEMAAALDRLAGDGTFLEPVTGRPGHHRTTAIGGAFVRRAHPPVPGDLLRGVVGWFLDHDEIENALALCASIGDPDLALRAALAVDQPEQLTSTDALDAVLAVASRVEPHPRVTELYGDLHHMRGDWDKALTAYAKASAGVWGDASGSRVPMRLFRKRAMTLYLRGRLEEADEVCDGATLDGTDPAEEARLLSWQATLRWVQGDADACEAIVRRAEALAVRSGDDAALASTNTVGAMLAAMRGDRGMNKVLYGRAIVHAERAGDVVALVRARTNLGSRLTSEGSYSLALEQLHAAIDLAELSGSQVFTGLAYNNRAEAYIGLGRLDDALRDLQRSRAIYVRLQARELQYAVGNMGRVRFLRGQRHEAVELLEEALEAAEAQRDTQGAAAWLLYLSRTVEVDDPDRSLDDALRAIQVGHPFFLPDAMTSAGFAELRRGNLDEATAWAHRAIEAATDRRARPSMAEALMLEATLVEPPDVASLQRALVLWEELEDPIGVARTRLLLARTVTGSRRELLIEQAERALHELGARGYLADDRIARTGLLDRPTVSIATLGGFRVSRGGTTISAGEWRSRKARDLLKLLVARRGAPVVRDEVVELLWADDTDGAARKLSVVLSMVRGVLDPDKEQVADHYVAADLDTIWLVRDHVEVDVEQFLADAARGRSLLASGRRADAHDALSSAAARYLGDFCADDPYADWAAGMRDLAKHTFVDTSFELAGLADASGEHSEAIRSWLQILDVDPYDEDAHLGMIRSLLAQRRHGEARRAYAVYRTRLAELDVDAAPFPSP